MAEEQDQEEESPLDNPDEPCNNCGNTEWTKFEERTPSEYPDASDVVKHYFSCTECGGHGYIFETGGTLQYSANLRQ